MTRRERIFPIVVTRYPACPVVGVDGSAYHSSAAADQRVVLDKKKLVRPKPGIISPRAVAVYLRSSPILTVGNVEGKHLRSILDHVMICHSVNPAFNPDRLVVNLREATMINAH